MNKITNKQLFDLYADTANRCSSDVKLLTNEEIEYNIFEEFDVGVMSFFHDDNLNKMINEVVIKKRHFRSVKKYAIGGLNWPKTIGRSTKSKATQFGIPFSFLAIA